METNLPLDIGEYAQHNNCENTPHHLPAYQKYGFSSAAAHGALEVKLLEASWHLRKMLERLASIPVVLTPPGC